MLDLTDIFPVGSSFCENLDKSSCMLDFIGEPKPVTAADRARLVREAESEACRRDGLTDYERGREDGYSDGYSDAIDEQ